MWYYYSVYNKEIKIFLWISSLILIFLVIYIFLPIWSHIDNVKINTESWKLIFDDTQMKSIEKYDYYQTYIYPNKFILTCESKDINICEKIAKNQDMLKNYVVWFFWKDLKTGNPGKVEIETFLSNNQNKKNMIKEIFTTLYIWNQTPKTESGYEKYFDYKKTPETNQIILNDLEIMCITNIKNSIPIWSFDEENTIIKRTKDECSWYANINPIQIAFWWSTESKEKVKLDLKITELKVSYKFFKKEEKEFKEKQTESLIIPSNIDITDSVNLKDL